MNSSRFFLSVRLVNSASPAWCRVTRLFSTERKRLDVAIVGAPNAGKSQLLNALTESNVAAVSRKRHTTRDGILGARTIDQTQLIFVDTPGFLRKESARQEGLIRDLLVTATEEMATVDYTLIVIDAAKNLTDDFQDAIATLMSHAIRAGGREEEVLDDDVKESNPAPPQLEKFAIVLNKVDLVSPKAQLLNTAEIFSEMAEECIKNLNGKKEGEESTQSKYPDLFVEMFPTIFYISALKGHGIDDLLDHLLDMATPCRAWTVPAGTATTLTPLERVEELLREKLYRCLHREVPHHVEQVNRMFREMTMPGTGEKVLRIDQDLVVRTKSHHRLVNGSGQTTLKRIEESAKRDLEKMFGCKVALHLHVKLSTSQHPVGKIDAMPQGVIHSL